MRRALLTYVGLSIDPSQMTSSALSACRFSEHFFLSMIGGRQRPYFAILLFLYMAIHKIGKKFGL